MATVSEPVEQVLSETLIVYTGYGRAQTPFRTDLDTVSKTTVIATPPLALVALSNSTAPLWVGCLGTERAFSMCVRILTSRLDIYRL
jgi:hypothetical protein